MPPRSHRGQQTTPFVPPSSSALVPLLPKPSQLHQSIARRRGLEAAVRSGTAIPVSETDAFHPLPGVGRGYQHSAPPPSKPASSQGVTARGPRSPGTQPSFPRHGGRRGLSGRTPERPVCTPKGPRATGDVTSPPTLSTQGSTGVSTSPSHTEVAQPFCQRFISKTRRLTRWQGL